MKTSVTRRMTIMFIVLALFLALAAGWLLGSQVPPTASSLAAPATPTQASATGGIAAAGLSTAIRQVAQQVKPAVVQITNEQVQAEQFSQPFTVPAGVGSGVIYDKQGLILTNNHVVEDAGQLLITLPDGRSFKGRLLGGDPQTDLAVVKIDATNLPVAQLGSSDDLQVGDWVVAIGNALALPGGPTVTAGVVSALGRTVQEPGSAPNQPGPYLFDVIQTDAPINPGNSGGPLVNLAGQVVGISTLVAGQAEPGVPAQGIGFAIATSAARPIADQLASVGHAVHPYIGISYASLNPALAAQLGISLKDGAVLGEVVPGSPAERAGLQVGDVISAIDGQPLVSESTLSQIVDGHKPGDRLALTVTRNAQQLNVTLVLGEKTSP